MKKYLFNKIKLTDSGIKFIPFRDASIVESFLATTNSSFDQSTWQFIPCSFKEFLKMLSKTKLNDQNQYDITTKAISTNPLAPESEMEVPFETMLQLFASEIYQIQSPDEAKIREFYTRAYQIKDDAQLDKFLLEKDPQEFIKE